jgi:hypothetical protein
MTDLEYDICETQGRIYEYAATQGYNLEKFSPLYLQSDFCKRAMDTIYSRFQLEDELECWDFIYPEIKNELSIYEDNKTFDRNVAYWIGFTYRQSYIATGISSSDLSQLLDIKTMCDYYPGLHTIDEDEAMEIINNNLSRKIRNKYEQSGLCSKQSQSI